MSYRFPGKATVVPMTEDNKVDLTPENRSGINVRILDDCTCPISCTSDSASFAGQSPIWASTANSLGVWFPRAVCGLSPL